jgi:hypothetical protein
MCVELNLLHFHLVLYALYTLRCVPKFYEIHTGGGFHKSWAHGVKWRVHPNLGENAIS